MSRTRFRTRKVDNFLSEIFFFPSLSSWLEPFWRALLLQLTYRSFVSTSLLPIQKYVMLVTPYSLSAHHSNMCLMSESCQPWHHYFCRHLEGAQCLSVDNMALTAVTWERGNHYIIDKSCRLGQSGYPLFYGLIFRCLVVLTLVTELFQMTEIRCAATIIMFSIPGANVKYICTSVNGFVTLEHYAFTFISDVAPDCYN